MKKFNKIKYIVNRPLNEDLSARKQEDDEVIRIKGDLQDQRREQERQDGMKASGHGGDQQQRAPVNPDGSPVSLDDIKDRMPTKGLDGAGRVGYSKIGIGTHGSEKRKGIIPSLMRGAGHIKSLADVAKKGAPVLPVAEDLYEDEEGNLRRFGKITTASAAGNPYYFEFDHYDKASGQNLVLYGTAPGTNQSGSDLQPIALKVKTIVPRDKMDVRPMTAPTDANTQSNFVSEAKKFSKDGAVDGTTVDSAGNMTTGTSKRGPDGRFIKGNQSGVQYAPKETNPPAIIPGGNMTPAKVADSAYELSDIMSKGGGYSSGGGGGGSGGGGAPPNNPPNEPGIQTIRRQYKPEYSKQKEDDRVNIPKNLWYHPSIQRMIKRFIAMNKTNTRIKIGGHYGVLVRSDPGDGDSRLKLVRKIPRTHIPKIFLDDDFIAEIIEFAPVPPNIPPGTAMAAVGLGLTQTMGLPMSASRSEAKQALAGIGNKQSAGSISHTPTAGALTNGAPRGNQLTIGTSTPTGDKVRQESLLDNDRLNYLIHGIDEGFMDWLGTTLGKGASVAKNMYRRGRIGIKKLTRAFEKQTGMVPNSIDYENIMNRVKWILGTQDHEGPEWSGDIKGGPEDVDLDPDNNVDFVGDTRPDPTGQSPEPTKEPTKEPTQEPTEEPTEEPEPHKWTWVSPYRDSVRVNPHGDEQKQIDSRLMEIDKEVIEFHNNMTLGYAVENMIAGYKKYKHPKPSPRHMLGLADEPAELPDSDTYIGRDYNQTALNQLLINKSQWPDLTTHDLLAMDELPITQYHETKPPDMDWEHWFELLTQNAKGKATRRWLADELNIPMFVDWASETLNFSGGETHTKNKLDNTQSALQYLGRMAWEQNKVNIFSPDYEFNAKHFRSEKYDPNQKDHNMDGSNIKPSDKFHNTPTHANNKPKQGKFFDKGNSSPGQFGHELGKKVDAAKQVKQKQQDKDKQKKARLRRRRRGKKRLEESFDSIRKLVTGN